jgi:two-component system alkaline phosphatase synthesis response regulator PhoP
MPAKNLILLVDDDVDFVEMNRAVLEAHGYKVAAAFSGQEGLQKARELKPALIVLDVMMDYKTEGFHATYELRQDPELQKIPIIMVTAINKQDFIGRFQPDADWLPVEKLIDKPITPQRLLDEVQKALGDNPKPKKSKK